MKKDLHPKYFKKTTYKCACGAEYKIGSTRENVHVDVCASCHPFYTGKSKIVDEAGQVDKFKKRLAKTKELQTYGGSSTTKSKAKRAQRKAK